ncbi:OpgC domain-containing protein [Cupriavidus pampae]|uniref:OpgC domain-containing protein n=1 Tax=Cupriavidus pampae TaxID=659251 RepID=A0ABN7ZAV2_9BURK|nr:OpgC domain-containing protein [Cupriavidus pampae]CAG9183080.1 hypothetical protein LMG32289_05272 [Cupriavidus pampae]
MLSSPAHRNIEIDFIRGLALLFIVVDHVDGSVLGQFTLRNFAACDAAEAFVFLSGYSAAAAFQAIAERKDPRTAQRRFLRRGWEIYRAFIVTALLMLACGLILTRLAVPPPALDATEIAAFLASPFSTLIEVVTLARQPYVADILPMYMLFMLAVPVSIGFATRSPYGFLVTSVVLWALAPWLGKALPTTTEFGWTFNPFAWQLLFALGLLARLRPDAVLPDSPGKRRTITWLAVAMTLFGIVVSYLWMRPELFEAIAPEWLRQELSFGEKKSSLAAIRLASFLGIAWLVYLLGTRGWFHHLALALRPVAQIGKRSLFCFVIGSVISIGIEGMTYAFGGGYPAKSVALFGDICAVALLLCAGVIWDRIVMRRRAPLAAGARQ